jgi:hypothetical protein
MELNGNIKTITDIFFSKDNISTLNKSLLDKNNLLEINKDGKKKIIDLLIKNMKSVYKSLDLKKINKKNIESIFQQFNKLSYGETQKELSSNDILAIAQLNASQLKFDRDFNSNPNNGNQVSDRPKPSQNQFLYPPDINSNKGTNSNKDTNNDKFDRLFKPIVEQVNENYTFNQYQFGKGSEDINKRMDQLNSERDGETRMNGRPTTPDFLKPMKTQLEKNDYESGKNNSTSKSERNMSGNNKSSRTIQDIPKHSGKPDFTRDIPNDELDMGFLSANDNGDLYNINNIDNPIELREIEEDTRSFQDRLKTLEHERNSVNIPPSRNKIDFTSENFSNNQMNNRDIEVDEIPDYEPKTVEQIREEKEIMEMRKRQEIREQSDFKREQFEAIRREMSEQVKRDMSEQVKRDMSEQVKREMSEQVKRDMSEQVKRDMSEQVRRNMSEQVKRDMSEQVRRYDSEQVRRYDSEQVKRYDSEQVRKNIPGQVKFQEQYNQTSLSLNDNIQLKPQNTNQLSKSLFNKNLDISKIQNTLKKLGMVDAQEVENIKKENEMLKNQMEYLSENKLDLIKQEITLEFAKLNEKEILISKKAEEMKLLMKKYHYLYGTTNIQLDISPSEPHSDFSFEFGPVENIIGMKLMSYSIPQPRYNIESGKNNIFQIKNTDNEIIELILNSGKYVIDNLIKKLNSKSEKYKFELNDEQLIEIKSEESFEIISTPLSKEILGFTLSCTEKNEYISVKPWDLRIEEKIFLFINNLDDSTPYAVLYTNNQGNYQFKFEEPILLDRLELSFKDSKGRPFNFYGLPYSLNIQLEINNPIEELYI